MGEVYRARDTKLNRFVAIKVLPESLSKDQDALARFEREAHSVAASTSIAQSSPVPLRVYTLLPQSDLSVVNQNEADIWSSTWK